MDKDSQRPLVSIQCMAYNHERFIRQCLEGIVAQKTNFKFEAVVHDDASTDGTASIIREFADKYPDIIKPIYESENLFSKDKKKMAKIVGEQLRGKYIGICECDDYWTDSQKLQLQVDFLESHPDYTMCFHSARKQYECDQKSWLNCEHIEDRDYDATDVFVNWMVPTASVLCRKEVWDTRHNLIGAERILNSDISLILHCAMEGRIRGMSRQMSVYRIHSGGVTYDINAKKRRAMRAPHHFECLKENFPIVDRKPLDDTISKTYFERALIQSRIADKLKDFAKSLKYSPGRFLSMTAHTLWKKIKGKE